MKKLPIWLYEKGPYLTLEYLQLEEVLMPKTIPPILKEVKRVKFQTSVWENILQHRMYSHH